jgi:hypothetical protein
MIDINGLSRAAVLAALYNRSKPLGMGFMQYDPSPMTIEEATTILKQSKSYDYYFDYLKGRVMKVSLASKDHFDERLYDRDNGNGAAQQVIDQLRSAGAV